MNHSSHRVISISLNEQDWQAFVRVHPQPVHWLREKIQESIAAAGAPDARALRAGMDAIAAPPSATGAASRTSATRP